MVQKIKPKKGNKSGHNDQKSKDNKETSKDTSIQTLFKELNEPLYKKGYVKPDSIYDFYIVSRNWLRKFRRANKTDDMEDLHVINNDLLAYNVYGFENKKIDQPNEYILKNNLILDDDYEAVTDEAWNLLTTVGEHITIRKSFYVNEDYEFNDMDDSIFVNVMFIDKNKELHKLMLNMNKPRKLEAYYNTLLKYFQVDMDMANFLLFDSRKSVKEFESAQKESILLAKLVDTSVYFPYNKLKDHDILIICASVTDYKLNVDLDEKEGAYCYNCRDCTYLYYHCSCKIVSYCSIDCKYSDFLYHRAFCDKISNDVNDVLMDLKNLEQNETNEGLVGLRNIGNSCYLNCLLQAIKYNDIIRTHLATRDPQFIIDQSAFTNSLYHFFYVIWHSKRNFIRPWLLKIALGLKHKDYLYFDQNDAHECLMSIIDDINEVSDPMYKSIAQNYRGRLISKIKCINCSKEIQKHENFYSLSLPLIEEKLKNKLLINRVTSADLLIMTSTNAIVSNQTKLTELIYEGCNAVLYLSDQEKISYILDIRDEELHKILIEAKEAKNQESFLILQYLEKESNNTYIGLSFTETKPTANKFFDMKSKICRMRLLPVEVNETTEPLNVMGQDVKTHILRYLLLLLNNENGFSKELEALNHESLLVRSKVTAKLLNYDPYIPAYEKPIYPKKHHFKIEKPKDNDSMKKPDTKTEDFEYDKSAYEKAIKRYEEEYKAFIQNEKDLALADDISKTFSPLPIDLQCEMFYINKADVCQNCGKKMKHQCKFKADQKLTFISNRLIEINIEFPKNSLIAQRIKTSTSFESELKPLNLSNQKAELSLRSCLDGFFGAEKIEFKCEACSSSYSVIKTEIEVCPDTLIIQFKRFATIFKENKIKQIKNEQFIDYDFQLHINDQTYVLTSVINHKGEINHGHYTSYSYNDCVDSWILYDDENVREISDPSQIKSKENYILFYKLRKPLN